MAQAGRSRIGNGRNDKIAEKIVPSRFWHPSNQSVLSIRFTNSREFLMVEKEKILNSIYQAVDEVNEQLSEDQQLEKSPDTVLLGESGQLESIDLVNILVATEENVESTFGVPISITDERAVSEKNSPFKTIGTLCDFISNLLKENSDG
jgi:acyl carrier protein